MSNDHLRCNSCGRLDPEKVFAENRVNREVNRPEWIPSDWECVYQGGHHVEHDELMRWYQDNPSELSDAVWNVKPETTPYYVIKSVPNNRRAKR